MDVEETPPPQRWETAQRRCGGGAGFGRDDQDRRDSGLSPDLCDGIVRRVLLHLRDPDALVELL